MQKDNQKQAFVTYEANSWFQRNKFITQKYNSETDPIMGLLKKYSISPTSILEVGCSAGYRLAALKAEFPESNVVGVEPSTDAIEYGQTHYPSVSFANTTIDDMSMFPDASFDVVVIGFVLYVVDRRLLLKAISEVDRVLKNGGKLFIIDFYSEKALKRKYQHINEFDAYTFKQNYDLIFAATQLYHLIDKACLHHDHMTHDTDDFQNLFSISMLKKDLDATY